MLIGGGGGGGDSQIFVLCPTNSFGIRLISSGPPPPPQINALATAPVVLKGKPYMYRRWELSRFNRDLNIHWHWCHWCRLRCRREMSRWRITWSVTSCLKKRECWNVGTTEPLLTRAKLNNLINVVDNLLQCCAAPCQQLLSTTIVHSCSRSTVIVQSLFNHCWQPSTSFSHQLLSAQFQQHCNNYCSLSTSNNYWSNNTHQHCEFNKCCWILITTLFRRCSTNNVASIWSIIARVLLMFLCKRGILETQWTKFWGSFEWGSDNTCVNSFFV